MRGYKRTGWGAGNAAKPRAFLALLALLLGLSAITAAVAPAQDVTTIDLPPPAQDPGGAASNPGPTCEQATGQGIGCDTQATPVAKTSALWSAVGGAEFGKQGELVDGSQTPDTVDFYGVRFLSETDGYAVGAACEDGTPFAELDTCPREPVIWHYSAEPGQPASWEQVYRGPGRGYVAAIAPLPDGELLAVGGDGHYPRRELARADGEADAAYAARDLAGDEANASGHARVWLIDPTRGDSGFDQLDGSDLPDLPDGTAMAGLDTVDCSPRPADGGLCAAGGLRQIWMWRGRQFTKGYSGQSPASEVEGVSGFRFRVRQIRFLSGATVPPTQAIAVTSGCCSGSATTDSPRLLKFDGSRWFVRLLVAGQPTNQPTDSQQDSKPRETLPDSYYSLFVSPPDGVNNRKLSVIASPGGPATDRELPSRVIGGRDMDGGSAFLVPNETDVANELGAPSLSSMRLNAGDGDFAGPGCGEAGGGCTFSGGGSTNVPGGAGGLDASLSAARGGPDGVMDWAVGELRPGGQGIAYTTVPGPTPVADATACPEQNPAAIAALIGLDPANAAKCQPTDAGTIEAGTQDKRLVSLPTYALNGFAFVPGSGIGWAVGARGAIERLGGGPGTGTHDPLPPDLPTGQPQTLPAAGAYDGVRPAPDSGEVGEVSGQASLPTRQLPHPEFIPTGSPDTSRSRAAPSEEVTKMVMSRDGDEGWAIGPGVDAGAGGTTLYHYDGSAWSRCDTEAIPDQVPPDPRCAALAPLRENSESGRPAPVGLGVAARVPLERDADPSNDDDFEVIAMGGQYQAPGTQGKKSVVTRYRDGRWSIDQQATDQLAAAGLSKPLDLAFTAPNDGWLVGDKSFGPSLFHYDGTKWVNCADDRAACGDSGSVLPISSSFATTGKNTGYLSVAGDRVYFAGTRLAGNETLTGFTAGRTPYPVILYRDPGGSWTAADGGYDPGCAQRTGATCEGSSDSTQQGCLTAISVGMDSEGGYAGWAAGMFGGSSNASCPDTNSTTYSLLRLGSGQWQPWTADDASKDYLWPLTSSMLLTLPHPDHRPQALLLPRSNFEDNPSGPMLGFSGQRWEATGTPFSLVDKPGSFVNQGAEATPRALAPDGQGGFWIAVRRNGNLSTVGPDRRSTRLGTFFYHYTDRAPEQVFQDVPHPIREQITAAAGGADGSFWVATASKAVYRYDRVTGWEKIGIPGWDPGRVVTRPSEANAIAVGPDGSGVVVGRKGRIADLTPTGIALDPASSASTVCNGRGGGDCGVGFDLQAAAVGPDGSAMVGGDRMALLYRPSGDAFQAIARPPAAPDAQITGIAMPSGGSAWLTTDTGQVWAGTGHGSDWSWRLESLDSEDHLLTLDSGGDPIPLRAIAIDSSGHGYAVGDQGIVLERTGGGDLPWERLDTGFRYDLDSVALPATGQGPGALIGGLDGLVLTRSSGRFVVARTPDPWDPVNTGQSSQTSARIVGLALLPGTNPGQLEAWAASQVPASQQRTPAPGAILHYTNAPSDPLLDGGAGRARQLPDTTSPGRADVSIAAFGRSDCRLPTPQCPEPQGTNLGNETIARGIADRLINPPPGEGPIDLALFTGDVDQTAGRNTARGDNLARPDTPLDTDAIHHRWVELYADRLWSAGIPFYGALGPQDLSQAQSCYAQCATTHRLGSESIPGAGTSGPWRESLAAAPPPWGDGPAPAAHNGITVVPLSNPGTAGAPGGGAATHYAADLERDGQKLVRLVVLDNSLGSLQASDANSNPLEAGGQLGWLRDVLISRPAGERAIVALSTPTYSYGPGSLTETSSDVTQLETVLFQGNVDAVVAGRLGWNALYWASAPALHSPAPGSGYPDPQSPPPPQAGFARSIPFLIASGAGGTFNSAAEQQGQTTAANGFWHGYSILRLDPASGDISIEQRPILDWVGIAARRGATHVVRAGKRLELAGYGREAGGTDVPFRYDEISTPAITHRFDLLYADAEHPWLPATDDSPPSGITADGPDSCGPYVCIDTKTGTIDKQSGQVRAGNGNYPRTFALAELSVGETAATYPLVFEPRASYRPPRPTIAPPVAVPAPPPAAAPPPAQTPTASAPPAPVLPVLAAQTPPPPPAPPAPPTFASQAPIDLSITPTALDVSPPTAVSQPPTPPVNPAPPSGARREARQRQAAAQKSGADSDQESSEAQDLGGDAAQGPDAPHGAAATRHDNAFTAISDHGQPSAWTRDLLLGGGLGAAALILALGITARPTPRRRQPEVPAPAWARQRRRG